MKTVGLITMHRILNCGSQLQTIATVRAVERCGCQCQVIDYLYPTAYHFLHARGNAFGRMSALKSFLRAIGLQRVARCVKMLLYARRNRMHVEDFLSRLDHTETVDRTNIGRLPPFDVYLTGSDQVWNPNYVAEDRSFLLEFTPEGSRRIAYAASFGVSELPVGCRESYAQCLCRYSAISVREPSGVAIVESLTGRQALPVVDPTFLLSAAEWRRMASSRLNREDSFVFCYVLSYFDPGPWIVSLIRAVADRLQCSVVFYSDGMYLREAESAGFEARTGVLPHDEFLEYVDKSRFVVTTSFHGTAFSVNLQKDFITVMNPAQTKDDRAFSLLKRLGLSTRALPAGSEWREVLEDLSVDYSESAKVLDKEISGSMDFLRGALADTL